jgi:hypothetical protein
MDYNSTLFAKQTKVCVAIKKQYKSTRPMTNQFYSIAFTSTTKPQLCPFNSFVIVTMEDNGVLGNYNKSKCNHMKCAHYHEKEQTS